MTRRLPHSHFVDILRPKLKEILYRLRKPVAAKRVFNQINNVLRKYFTIEEVKALLSVDPVVIRDDSQRITKFYTEWEPSADQDISWRHN